MREQDTHIISETIKKINKFFCEKNVNSFKVINDK